MPELQDGSSSTYEIRDGSEILAILKSIDHALGLLKILQEGE